MTDADQWLLRYEREHRGVRNAPVYWLAAPTLVLGTVGLLWALPVPAGLTDISPLLNWGSVFLMATMVYYFIISIPLAIGMLPFVLGVTVFETWLADTLGLLQPVATTLTAGSLAGLYAGHVGNGGLPAVARDVQLMMIAPVWMLSLLYRKLGIPH